MAKKRMAIPYAGIMIIVLLYLWAPAALAVPPVTAFSGNPASGVAPLPLSFIPNAGQLDPEVVFTVAGHQSTFFFTKEGIVITAQEGGSGQAAVRIIRQTFPGSAKSPAIGGTDPLPGGANYFIGSDPSKWQTNLLTYGAILYRDLYPGIDLRYTGTEGVLKREFVVAPGADPSVIRLRYEGIDAMRLDDTGALILTTGNSTLTESPVTCYQEVGSEKVVVPAVFSIAGDRSITFSLGTYNPSFPLVIDPALVYATYLGGSDSESGPGIAVDGSGNAYVTGLTYSSDFPTTAGAYNQTYGYSQDVYVTKLNPSGSALLYSTFLGGSVNEAGYGIAVDSTGSVYVTGLTSSADFPTTAGAYNRTLGGYEDGFVTKLNPSGSALVYSTFLGGSDGESGYGIAVDSSGNAYVIGGTNSADFPTTAGAYNRTHGGSVDIFAVKLNPSGSSLVYATFVGGSDSDHGFGIAIDGSGNAYITGCTASTDFPTTAGAYNRTYGGGGFYDGIITKLNPSGSALVYSTFLGGLNDDEGNDIAVDSSGNAYVTGDTSSPDFPTTAGAWSRIFNLTDAFVTKLNPSGSALLYSTFLGGLDADRGYSIAVDGSGNAYVTGYTTSAGFPTTADAYNRTISGYEDAFVTKVNPAGSALLYSTFLGGHETGEGGGDSGYGIAVDGSGNAYVTGDTTSADFPTTAGAYNRTFGGNSDTFIAKLSLAGFAERVHNLNSHRNYTSIQAAINDAAAGDTIAADSGTYTEQVNVNVTGITLRANNTGSGPSVVDAGGSGTAITVNANGVTIDGFAATGSGSGRAGIYLANSQNSALFHNNASYNGGTGIWLGSSGSNQVLGNTVTGNARHGIALNFSDGNTVRDNVLDGNTLNGLYLGDSGNNVIINNTAQRNHVSGILLDNEYGTGSNNNALSFNNASLNDQQGFNLFSVSNNSLSHNSAVRNTFNGINVLVSRNTTLSSNTITGNLRRGIYLNASVWSTVTGNTVSANQVGLLLTNTSSGNTIYNNYFNNTANVQDSTGVNTWNVTRTPGANILGGPFIGGNFWSNYAGTDTDGDGIGNTLLPYTGGGSIVAGGDWLPLTGASVLRPVASFSGTPASGTAPLAVTFTDLSSGSPTGWAWFFGDEKFTGAWTRMNAGAAWEGRRGHSSVALPDGSIVLMGGEGIGGYSNFFNDVWRSADNGATWTRINSSAGWLKREAHCSVALPDGSIVLMGGKDSSAVYLNDVWRSTDKGATWQMVNAGTGWPGRDSFSCVAMPDGSIVLMGGYNSGTHYNDVWRSTNNGTTWTEMNASAGWAARDSFTSVVTPEGRIVLIGGYSNGIYYHDVWRSADNGATWAQVTSGTVWTPRDDFADVVMPDGSIVLMGGASAAGLLNDVWRSADNGATWTLVNASAGWTPRWNLRSLAMPDGGIVISGGYDSGGIYRNDTWRLMPAGSSARNPSHTYTAPGSYSVALQAYNTNGYNSTRKAGYIAVRSGGNGKPAASFTGTPTSGTAPLTVTFTDTSDVVAGTMWNWSFGDTSWSNTTARTNPVHAYVNNGTYSVSLRVTNASGSNTSYRPGYITVGLKRPGMPAAGFTGTPISGTAPLMVTFTDTSDVVAGTMWNWSFGDTSWSNTTTRSNPVHIYLNPGSYNVSLRVANATGSSTASRHRFITVTPVGGLSVVNFSANTRSGVAPLTITFTVTSDVIGGTMWFWDFGDGTWFNTTDVALRNPVHTYNVPGAYTVSLTVTNASGWYTFSQPGLIAVSSGGGGGGRGGGGGGGAGGGAGTVLAENPAEPQAAAAPSQTYSIGFEGMSFNADGQNTLDISLPAAQASGAVVTVYFDRVEVYQHHSPGVTSVFWGEHFTVNTSRITGKVSRAEFVTDPLNVTIGLGNVSGSVRAALPRLIRPGTLEKTLSGNISADTSVRFGAIAAANGLHLIAVAYTLDLKQDNLTTGIAHITLTVPSSWVNSHGGLQAVRIPRISSGSGGGELLVTAFAGTDARGIMTFVGESPNGTSLFGLVTAEAAAVRKMEQPNLTIVPVEIPPMTTNVGMFGWLAGVLAANPLLVAVPVALLAAALYFGWWRRRL